ncbi:MAG: DNA-binding protein [Bacteroidota bacterium]|nr:DNA-binding protein [uncultured Allomuricauda sp.]
MPASIVTSDDLERLKEEMLYEIKEILIKYERITIDRWIKSGKVMDKLEISPGTLQNFRINQTIPFTKLGGIIYYDETKINEIMVKNETKSKILLP